MSFNNMENDWLENNPSIKSAGKANPFSIPEMYFEVSSKQIIDNTRILSLFDEAETANFKVPTGYFDNLTKAINSRVMLEELKSKSGEVGMIVDSNYFSIANNKINDKVNLIQNKSWNLIPLKRRSWFRYAAAASVFLAIGSAVYVRQVNNSFEYKIAKVSESEIVNYLQTNSENADMTSIIENLDGTDLSKIDQSISDEELTEYLKTTL